MATGKINLDFAGDDNHSHLFVATDTDLQHILG